MTNESPTGVRQADADATAGDAQERRLRTVLEAAQAALDAHLAATGRAIPLNQAAAAWGISEHAALQRARRGRHGAFKRNGRWMVREEAG
jgi:hypothetical protein